MQNADSVLEYWSRGRRRNEIEPLMLSLVDPAQDVGLVLLFPQFARSRLYTYETNAQVGDCHWTSFNFFREVPDDRFFGNRNVIEAMITREYDFVASPDCFGDVVLIMHNDGVVHSCVHVAADIVYTKNGCGDSEPFILEKLENVVDLYEQQYGSIKLAFARRKDMR